MYKEIRAALASANITFWLPNCKQRCLQTNVRSVKKDTKGSSV